MDVRAGLVMHGDAVRAGLRERIEIRIDGGDHQMDVERLGGDAAHRLHDRGAERDVGHEMPVHDVDMDPVGAGRIDGADLLTQFGEVGGQDRGGDADGLHECVLAGDSRGAKAFNPPPKRGRNDQARFRRVMKKPSQPPCSASMPGSVRTVPVSVGVIPAGSSAWSTGTIE